jgi:hypothetical protein
MLFEPDNNYVKSFPYPLKTQADTKKVSFDLEIRQLEPSKPEKPRATTLPRTLENMEEEKLSTEDTHASGSSQSEQMEDES